MGQFVLLFLSAFSFFSWRGQKRGDKETTTKKEMMKKEGFLSRDEVDAAISHDITKRKGL